MSAEMFTEIILDYYRHPRHRGSVADPDIAARDSNPLCGDALTITGQLSNGTLSCLRFDGKGCAISQAAADMLCEHLEGKPVETVTGVTKEDVLRMLNIAISPVRLKCALLALKVLKLAAYEHLGRTLSREEAEL